MKKQLGCEKFSNSGAEKIEIKSIYKDTKYKFVPSPEKKIDYIGPTGTIDNIDIHGPAGTLGPVGTLGTCGTVVPYGLVAPSYDKIYE